MPENITGPLLQFCSVCSGTNQPVARRYIYLQYLLMWSPIQLKFMYALFDSSVTVSNKYKFSKQLVSK